MSSSTRLRLRAQQNAADSTWPATTPPVFVLNSVWSFNWWNSWMKPTSPLGTRNKSSVTSVSPERLWFSHEADLPRLQREHADCAGSGRGDASVSGRALRQSVQSSLGGRAGEAGD